MRVYLPSTTTGLRVLLETRSVGPAPITGFAITPGLREWYVDDDVDELEYAAAAEAARASLRLIEADPGAGPRRVVLAVDVADHEVEVRDDLDRGVVRVTAPVPLSAVASVHADDADDADAARAVRLAADAIDAADLGDPEAQDRVDDAEGFELSWYANQEIPAVLDGS